MLWNSTAYRDILAYVTKYAFCDETLALIPFMSKENQLVQITL